MSIEAIIGIGVSVLLFIIGLFVATNTKKITVNQKNKNGKQELNNNTIGNNIRNKKDK